MPRAGQVVAGRYRLEYALGAGSMGSVWAATHLELDAPVALKFEHDTGAPRPVAAVRREARAAARLRSPHVIRTFDVGTDEGVAFIAMELLVGESLKTRLERRERLQPEETSVIVRQTASALDVAHRERLVHRDIKPSNLFLAREGASEIVKVLDFGIAKWLDPDAGGELRTASDHLVGSVAYMSPEQARGVAVDHRCDIWALAVVAYEALTGARPFTGRNIPETLGRICAGGFRMPSSILGPEYAELDVIFARALELEPSRRYPSAGDLARALDAILSQLQSTATHADEHEATAKAGFGRDSETASLVRAERVHPEIAAEPELRAESPSASATSPGSARASRRASLPIVVTAIVACAAALPFLRGHLAAPKTTAPLASSRTAPGPARLESALPPAVERAKPALVSPTATASAAAAPRASAARRRASPTPSATPSAKPPELDPLFGLEVPAQ